MASPNEYIELFAESLEIEPAALTPETRIADVEEWNSIGWLTIMSLVDERLSVQIEARAIRGFQTVQDVIGYLDGKVGAAQ